MLVCFSVLWLTIRTQRLRHRREQAARTGVCVHLQLGQTSKGTKHNRPRVCRNHYTKTNLSLTWHSVLPPKQSIRKKKKKEAESPLQISSIVVKLAVWNAHQISRKSQRVPCHWHLGTYEVARLCFQLGVGVWMVVVELGGGESGDIHKKYIRLLTSKRAYTYPCIARRTGRRLLGNILQGGGKKLII